MRTSVFAGVDTSGGLAGFVELVEQAGDTMRPCFGTFAGLRCICSDARGLLPGLRIVHRQDSKNTKDTKKKFQSLTSSLCLCGHIASR